MLTRDKITVASQIMLPTYPLLAVLVGSNYAFVPHQRLIETPSLQAIDAIMPLPAWGALFVLDGAFLLIALVFRDRRAYEFGLALLCGLMLVLGLVFAVTAAYGHGSPSAWCWPVFVAAACWATIRSLTTRETK